MEKIFEYAFEIDEDIYMAPYALIEDIKEFCLQQGKFVQSMLLHNLVKNQKYLVV